MSDQPPPLGPCPPTMPDVVTRIIDLAALYGVPEEALFERAKVEWHLPTDSWWSFFRMFPYS